MYRGSTGGRGRHGETLGKRSSVCKKKCLSLTNDEGQNLGKGKVNPFRVRGMKSNVPVCTRPRVDLEVPTSVIQGQYPRRGSFEKKRIPIFGRTFREGEREPRFKGRGRIGSTKSN